MTAILLVARPAAAGKIFFHGTICHASHFGSNRVVGGQYGVHNGTHDADAEVYCPLPLSVTSVSSVVVTVYNRGPSLPCSIHQTDRDGTLLWGGSQISFNPGWAPQYFTFSGPVSPAEGYFAVACTIPAFVTSGPFANIPSHVASITVNTP